MLKKEFEYKLKNHISLGGTSLIKHVYNIKQWLTLRFQIIIA